MRGCIRSEFSPQCILFKRVGNFEGFEFSWKTKVKYCHQMRNEDNVIWMHMGAYVCVADSYGYVTDAC